ncbi:transglycosylase domain-containing protein [Crocinitomicaceae bacterium]|nr:transglycosylase domain-containing protein [Crocinitomicaceae bacterium]
MQKNKDTSNPSKRLNKKTSNVLILIVWMVGLLPLFGILYLRYVKTEGGNLPSVAMLENQEEMLATTVFAGDGVTELGKYWKVNRTSVHYNEISNNVTAALVSTEDERYEEHSGIDAKAVGRALVNMGKAGGASTISQQLAKLMFTLKERDDKRNAQLEGKEETQEERTMRGMGKYEKRFYEKVKENIIALRLENRYTKKEIITMYLNQFDFLYNAVGIASAAKVYYNKEPKDLLAEEAAMLVGMCKNPGLYNPYGYKVKNYRRKIALEKGVTVDAVSDDEVKERKEKDSLRAVERRNTVLYKWYENSEKNNPALTAKITKEEYDSLKQIPLYTNYQTVDHKEGLAPYFRESLRNEVRALLSEKNEEGTLKYAKPDGSAYDIYEDGLKIYTTIDPRMQEYAEQAVVKHLGETLQGHFSKNNSRTKRYPFDNRISEETVNQLLNSALKRSERYRRGIQAGRSDEDVRKEFNEPIEMKVFSWTGEIDTVMTPMDSIRYYKNFLRTGLISIEPQTGFIKAWVGGADIHHFGYDHVKQGKRQVGSTIKPFIYSAGMRFGVLTSCETTPNIEYCVDVQTGPKPMDMTSWCPQNAGVDMNGQPISFRKGLAQSMNNITVAVMARMGGTAGPAAVAKLMRDLNIEIRDQDVVPAMCLGVMDLSLWEMVGAQCAFVNKGIYNKPTALMRIEDRNGNLIYEAIPQSKEVMSEELAYATVDIMKDVINGGTGGSLRAAWRPWGGITYPMAGKTGTTQNNADGWFMGLTPDLVTGVWVGAEDMAVRFRSMEWGQGARMALPIYGYLMQKVYADPTIKISKEDFEMPIGYENSPYNCRNNGQNNSNTSVPDLGF